MDSAFQQLIIGSGSEQLCEGHTGTQQSKAEDKVKPSKFQASNLVPGPPLPSD